MAKKRGNFSYIEAREALEAISATATKESIPYDLLRVFCGYGDASLARVADGRGNDAKDGKTILIKKLLAYRCSETNVFGDEDLYAILDDMRATPSISKTLSLSVSPFEIFILIAFSGNAPSMFSLHSMMSMPLSI